MSRKNVGPLNPILLKIGKVTTRNTLFNLNSNTVKNISFVHSSAQIIEVLVNELSAVVFRTPTFLRDICTSLLPEICHRLVRYF